MNEGLNEGLNKDLNADLNQSDSAQVIFHLSQSWPEFSSQRLYTAPSLETEGFIHASTFAQLAESANLHLGNHATVFVIVIAVDKLSAPLKWEKSRNSELFPHIYGPIPLPAVHSVIQWNKAECGQFQLNASLCKALQAFR